MIWPDGHRTISNRQKYPRLRPQDLEVSGHLNVGVLNEAA